jgi:hypothetical protein
VPRRLGIIFRDRPTPFVAFESSVILALTSDSTRLGFELWLLLQFAVTHGNVAKSQLAYAILISTYPERQARREILGPSRNNMYTCGEGNR